MSRLLRLVVLIALLLSALTAAHAVMNLGKRVPVLSHLADAVSGQDPNRKVLRVGHLPVT